MADDTVIEHSYGKRIKNFLYNQKDEIGKGFSSVVYRGINQLTKQEIAVKVIQLAKIKNQVQKYLLNNEMRALRKLNHPNVLKCLDILMTKNNVYIVTEFCKKGDLLSIVRKNGRLPEQQALRWAKDIAEGYLYIQQNRILHRDIKTANIFISNDDIAKVADFGFSEFIGEVKPSIPYNVGSPAYMSPESYQESHYSPQSDLWSIGIILFQMLVGEVPFKKCQYGELVRNLTSGNLGIPQNLQISEGTKRILVGCFKQRLNQRLTSRKLLEMIVHQLGTILRSNVPRVLQLNPQTRKSIVTKNRSSAYINEIIRSSQVNQTVNSANNNNIIIQGFNSYLNHLFRFGRLLSENKMPVLKSLVHNLFCIINKHRFQLITQGDSYSPHSDPGFRRDYDLIKLRMNELPEFQETRQPIDPNLRLINNTQFKSEQSLNGCINYIKFCIKQFDKLIDSQPKHLQNLGCIFDYLINYCELLQLQTTTSNVVQIANSGKLLVNIKDRPTNISQNHIKLLRFKRKMLNI